jgi:two-component system sensor histidine kinase UhpB
MKRLIRPPGWSFTTRLVTLALVPAILMFLAVNLSVYLMSLEEAKANVRERSHLIAAALAEGSRYGVISGNTALVERTVRGLMQADASIVAVEVMDPDRQALVTVRGHADNDAVTAEVPIDIGSIEVDLLDARSAGVGASGVRIGRDREVAGYVRVTVSPAPLLAVRRIRLLQGSVFFLLSALASGAVGLALARRLREPLNELMDALRRVRRGRFDINIQRTAPGELGELQSAIVDMAQGLGATHQQLEEEVVRRTSELQTALHAAKAADDERRRLIARGNELIEDERRRLALEIHDELNAAMVAVRLQANALAAKAADDGDADGQQAADRIAQLTDELYRRARAIVTQLRPEVIDTLGLSGAIEEMIRRYDELGGPCAFVLHAERDLPVRTVAPRAPSQGPFAA